MAGKSLTEKGLHFGRLIAVSELEWYGAQDRMSHHPFPTPLERCLDSFECSVVFLLPQGLRSGSIYERSSTFQLAVCYLRSVTRISLPLSVWNSPRL